MHGELRSQYLALISKMCGIEGHIILALPKMIEQVTDDRLREALTDHLKETKVQRTRMEEILQKHGGGEEFAATASFETMLKESEAEMTQITDVDVRDASIIASAVTVEHHEMSIYETLCAWANQLEENDDQSVFKELKKEEESAAKKLMGIAEGGLFSTGVVEQAVGAAV